MNQRLLRSLLAAFVLLDLAFSGVKFYHLRLDSDLAPIALPDAACTPVLHDPLGLRALLEGVVYTAPNRFFAHAAMVGYFHHVPFWLQRFVSPLDSVYLACALFQALVQALLVYLLAVYASGTARPSATRFWLAAALLAPLFQTSGYGGQMGIIDPSTTYTFFYAFPLALLLLLLLPFYWAAQRGQAPRLRGWQALLWAALAVVVALNGTVVTGVGAVLLPGIGLVWAWRHWGRLAGAGLSAGQRLTRLGQAIPLQPALLGLWLGGWCLYSLYLGRYEAESVSHSLPLWERYRLVPLGVYEQLTGKLGLPLLLLALGLNVWLLRRVPVTAESRFLRRAGRWLACFAAAYVALLPLGGYRSYREHILRYDTVMPLTLGLLVLYAASAMYLLRHLPAGRGRRAYAAGLAVLAVVYLNADRRLKPTQDNACERAALTQLAQTPGPVAELPAGCTVLSWEPTTDYPNSETNARFLYFLGVTPAVKLYRQAAAPTPAENWGPPQ